MYREPERHEESLQEELIAACAKGDLAKVNGALARGAKVDQYGRGSRGALTTALEAAAASGPKALPVVELLLERGAPLDPVRDRLMRSALFSEGEALVVFLKGRGVPVSSDGLLAACQHRSARAVRFCLRMGCDPRQRELGAGQRSVLHALAEREDKDAAALAEVMLEAGAELDAVDAYGRTPLFVAALRGNAPMVTLLLERGAAPDIAMPGSEPDQPAKTPEQAAKSATIRKLFTRTRATPRAAASPEKGRLTGAELEQLYRVYAGNFFEGPWAGDEALGRSLESFAAEHHAAHARAAGGDPVALETLLREEEGPEVIARFVDGLKAADFRRAARALAGAFDELDGKQASAWASRLRTLR